MSFGVPANPNTFADGQIISAAPMNANFTALRNDILNLGDFVVDDYPNATDTAKLQAAHDDAKANGGGVLVCQPRQYSLAGTVTMDGANVLVKGKATGDKMSSAGTGTKLQLASGVTGSGFNVTGVNSAIEDCYFSNNNGASTVPFVVVGAQNGFRMSRVFGYNGGGFQFNASARFLVEDCALQNYNGAYGFYGSGVQIAQFVRCNSAGVAGSSSINWYFVTGETVIMDDCEGNNVVAQQLVLVNTADSEFRNFQANGASGTQVQMSGCTDIDFDYLYILQPAPLGLSLANSSIVMFRGGWIGNQTQQAVVDGGTGQSHDIGFSGAMKFQQSTVAGAPSTADLLTFQGSCHNVSVEGCFFDGGSLNYHPIRDKSTDTSRSAIYSGNCMENFPAGYGSVLVDTYSPNVRYTGNAGTGEPTDLYGSGAPTMAAPKGSVYRNVTGSSGTLLYVNTSGGTTWVAFA